MYFLFASCIQIYSHQVLNCVASWPLIPYVTAEKTFQSLRLVTSTKEKENRASRGHLFRRFELLFQSSSEVWILRNPRRGSGMRDDPGCGKKPLEFRRFWCFDSPSVDQKKNDKAEIKNNRRMVSWGGTKDESHSIMYLRESTVSDMNAKEILKTNNNLKRASAVFVEHVCIF